jgi:hypothetical protein
MEKSGGNAWGGAEFFGDVVDGDEGVGHGSMS